MKKLLVVLLGMVLMFNMVGCSGGSGNAVQEDVTGETGETDETGEGESAESKSGVETDIKVSEDKIAAASKEELGDWEKEYTKNYAPDGEETFTWGFIDMGYQDTFTTKIRNTFTSYCEKNFPNVTVLEADGELDPNIQLQLAENFIAQGVDCIIIIPQDADGCVGVVDTCMAEGMPLVCLNSVIRSDHLEKEIGYVGSSNYEAGKLQAEWMIENVDDTETVIMCYQKGSDGYDHSAQRYNGLFDTLDEAGYNYDCKAVLISEYMRDVAMTNAEDWITSFGEEIQVIACCNDESAMGTLQAYQAAGIVDNVKILGIDANQDCLKEVEAGTIACTVFQNAMGQAKWGAISAYDACVNGKKETTSFSIPFETVDANNVDQYLD